MYETGYGSSSRVYERSNAQLGMTPGAYRKGGKGMKIGCSIAKSTLGNVLVAATERGISAVYLGDTDAEDSCRNCATSIRVRRSRPETIRSNAGSTKSSGASKENRQASNCRSTYKRRRFSAASGRSCSAFRRVRPKTYTEVARALGDPKAVRAVAMRACATNPVSIVVPCHRVIRQDGNLAGYRWGLSRKEQLLEQERAAAR